MTLCDAGTRSFRSDFGERGYGMSVLSGGFKVRRLLILNKSKGAR